MNKPKWKGESKPAIPWSPFTDLAEEADAACRKREGQKHISAPSYLLPTRSGDAQEQLRSIYDCSITSSPNKKMLDHTAFPEQSCELYYLIWGFAAAQTSVITPTSFFHLIQTALAYPYGSHTGNRGFQTVIPPSPVYGILQSCSWIPFK